MKRKFTLYFIFAPILLMAQAPSWYNQWVFGYEADSPIDRFGISQLDFNDNLVTIQKIEDMTYSFHLGDSGSFLCNNDGQRILSSNNCSLRNNDFEIIENGDNLNPGDINDDYCPSGNYPSSKCNLLLPELSNDSTFYLIHKDKLFDQELQVVLSKKLYLSVIVKRVDGSYYLKEKITLLDQNLLGWNLTGILSLDNNSWIISVMEYNSNTFHLFRVGGDIPYESLTSVSTGPIITHFNMSSQLTFSPDGTILAAANLEHGVILYDFDIATGELNYNTSYPFPNMDGVDGIMFSPNSRFVYLTAHRVIYQMDLDYPDEDNFVIQLDSIAELGLNGWPISAGNIYPGPDCRLYISPLTTTYSIHVIHQPDLKYPDCNYVRNAIIPPTNIYHNLPNMPTYMKEGDCYDNIAWGISSAVTNTAYDEGSLIAYPNPTSDYINFTIQDNIPTQDYTISLYNTAGSQVWSKTKRVMQNEIKIDVQSIEDGLYIYSLTSKNGKNYSGRIVVMK